MTLDSFRETLQRPDLIDYLRKDVIGEGMPIPGLFGENPLIYADYVASGRALRSIEKFVSEKLLPFYANSHTEASFVGQYVTRMRREARAEIARLTNADDACAVVFCGSGATAGLNRLVDLLGIRLAVAEGRKATVLIGPYEHHSNILPWRESGAEVIEIPETRQGGPDLAKLEACLIARRGELVVGSFSAASNVTGIKSPIAQVTKLLKEYGALSVWDFAGGAPYMSIDMQAGGGIDAVVASPHKFLGGPGASGIMILRKSACVLDCPSAPGGGTVSFVSPWDHDYSTSIEAREEAGTPDVIGDIRAALAFMVKDAVGQDYISQREEELRQRALRAWRAEPRLHILGDQPELDVSDVPARLPIFSMQVCDGQGGAVHQQLFTRMLSDVYGIQVRGGCACAGPYAHRLLGIDEAESRTLQARLKAGHELEKPGWTRLNFSYLASDEKADFIIQSVLELVQRAPELRQYYTCDNATARFKKAS